MSIKIIEQGIWPQDEPSEDIEFLLVQDHDGDWTMREQDCLEDGDFWVVLSKPEKSPEDMTEDELIEKVVARFGNGWEVVVGLGEETFKEALIRNLK